MHVLAHRGVARERIAVAMFVSLAAQLAACLSVPDVKFEPDASSASSFSSDGGREVGALDEGSVEASSAPEGGADDAAAAPDSADAGDSGATCPAGPPPGASICCGPVPCRGDAGACTSECTNCENNCADEVCCLDKHGNFQGCAKAPAACP